MNGLVIIALFIIPLFLGVPVAIALGISVIGSILFLDILSVNMFVQSLFSASDSFPLMAVPFFILTGDIMSGGGISIRLINFAKRLIGQVTGGLGIITVLVSIVFASISGSGPATVAAIGGIMIPAMVKSGYGKPFAATLTATAGSLGPIIPPSISFIIFGVVAGVSITDLFIAGIIPGLILGIALIIVVIVVARKQKFEKTDEKFDFKELLKSINEAKWGLLVPVIILGGIYSGIFTPTESAIIAAVYSLIIGIFVYKDLKIKELATVFAKSSLTSGYVLVLVGFATAFGRLLTMERIPQTISEFIVNVSSSSIITILLILVFLLLVGTIIETLAAIIIITPLLLPVAPQIGLDPIHLGVIMVVALSIGQVTPPVGVNLFVASGIADLKIEKMFVWLIPFVGVMIVVLVIIALVPSLSLYLVDILGK